MFKKDNDTAAVQHEVEQMSAALDRQHERLAEQAQTVDNQITVLERQKKELAALTERLEKERSMLNNQIEGMKTQNNQLQVQLDRLDKLRNKIAAETDDPVLN